MSHRAAIYSVRVHKRGKPKEPAPLGDIDEQGKYLGAVLDATFRDGFAADGGEKAVRCSNSKLEGEDLQLSFHHGERGVVADIMNINDELRLRQESTDTQLVRCGSLFRLPRNKTWGWWAVHINNNRSVKSLVHDEMVARFKATFPDLMLVVTPSVRSGVLTQALDDGRLQAVRLIKYDETSDFKDANQWLRQDTHAKIELRVSTLERSKRLAAQLAQRAVGGDQAAYGKIVEFEGLTFDEAKLEVELESGATRTFTVSGPLGGHPFTADIQPSEQNGEPTEASVFEELGRVLTEME